MVSMDRRSDDSLALKRRAEGSAEVIEGYKKAFSGISEEELSILDGIILEPEREGSMLQTDGVNCQAKL